jgi:phage baseplate assembly protein W
MPFRFDRGAAVVAEQDSTDDVVACVISIMLCPLGFRAELPGYGIEDPTFSQGVVQADDLTAAAVLKWEPRADLVGTVRADLVDQLVAHRDHAHRRPVNRLAQGLHHALHRSSVDHGAG